MSNIYISRNLCSVESIDNVECTTVIKYSAFFQKFKHLNVIPCHKNSEVLENWDPHFKFFEDIM